MLSHQGSETMRGSVQHINKARVFLVDDHPLVRKALRDTIRREGDLLVCGEAEDRHDALAGIASSDPDVAIIDLKLKSSDGLDLIREIRHRHPRTLTLVLSMHDESMHAERTIRAGACGYLSKQAPPAKILEAVRKVLNGEIYWSDKAAAQVASRVARSTQSGSRLPNECLSDRELQVFELIGMGASTTQIASSLHIDASTVETYRGRIKEKLDLQDAPALLQAAIRWNIDTAS